MNYFISDTHFGHERCLFFDDRPFTKIKDHDKAIIDNWNNTVGMDDDVYLLGDISWYNAAKTIEIFNNLNGNIHLIRGNHDGRLLRNRELQKRFVEITDYKELSIDKEKSIVLCHYPIPCFKNRYYEWLHFYGHVHNGAEWKLMEKIKNELGDACEMYNVGAMMEYINYTPRTMEEIIGYSLS